MHDTNAGQTKFTHAFNEVNTKTELFIHVFSTTNNNQKERNQGGINGLMQKVIKRNEPRHKIEDWLQCAEKIVAQVGGPYYAHDKKCEIHYYEPQRLTLWETSKPTEIPIPSTPKPRLQAPINPRKRKLTSRTYTPHPKRQKHVM